MPAYFFRSEPGAAELRRLLALSLEAVCRLDVAGALEAVVSLAERAGIDGTSARTLGLLRSEMAASAGFPNQANNFPDGPI